MESFKDKVDRLVGEYIKELEEEIKKLKDDNKRLREGVDAGQKLVEDLISKNKKLKHENSYRAGIVDILPKGKGHIAEETIQDLQKEIKNLKEELKYYKEKTDFLNKVIVKYQEEK